MNKLSCDKSSPYSTNRGQVEGRCPPPRIFRFLLDTTSTAPYFDTQGFPKRYTPTRQNAVGEWLYALNPNRDDPRLEGLALADHFREISTAYRETP